MLNIKKYSFNKSFVNLSITFLVIFIFISDWLQDSKFIILPSGTRHIFILMFFFINYLKYGKKISLPLIYNLSFFILIFYYFINFTFTIAPFYNYFLGFFFTFFFIFIFYFSSNTFIKIKNIKAIFKNFIIFIFLMSIIPLIQVLILRTTLRDNVGLFRELGAFGAAVNVAVITSLSLYIIKRKKLYLYLALFLTFIVFMTILKKSIASSFLIWIIFIFYETKSILRIKLFILICVISIIFYTIAGTSILNDISKNQIYLEGTGSENHVRLGMYVASFNIAFDYFPLGSGLGTFGSLASITNWYSDLYFQYGVAYIGANSPYDVARNNYTLLDTFWPHIIGELGFIGTIFYLILWSYPLFKSFQIYKNSIDQDIKGLAFFVFLILVIMTWEGFTLYTPEIPSFVLLHSGLVGLCFYHIKNHKVLPKFEKKNIHN
jgi:hypothetical protein